MSASHPYRVVPGPIGARRGPTVPRRVLVVAVEAVVPEGLAHADVVVVAPALNSRLRRWVSDEDAARGRAEARLDTLLERLRPITGHVEGRVGDADPLLAIGDALATFPADEVVVAVGPGERDDVTARLDPDEGAARTIDGVPLRFVVVPG